jgi:hypothetical protein
VLKRIVILFPLIILVSACTPRVELAMPSEPITINLNVKVDHQIRVKVDKQLDELFNDESGLF